MKVFARKSLLLVALSVVAMVGFSLSSSAAEEIDQGIEMIVENPSIEWNAEFGEVLVDTSSGISGTYRTDSSFVVTSTSKYKIEVEIDRKAGSSNWPNAQMNTLNPIIASSSAADKSKDHPRGFDIAVTGGPQHVPSTWSPLMAQKNDHWAEQPSTIGHGKRTHSVAVLLVLRDEDTANLGPTAGFNMTGQRVRWAHLPSGDYPIDVNVTITELP